MQPVLVYGENPMRRTLLELLLGQSGRYRPAEKGENAAVAILCIGEPGGEDFLRARMFKIRWPDKKLLVVSWLPECSWARRAREAGADGYWYAEGPEGLVQALDSLSGGKEVWPELPPVVRLGRTDSRALTGRELEVLRELTSGAANQTIAQRMNVSVDTVKYHLKSLLSKTGFSTRTELAVKARTSGIVVYDGG